MGDRYGNKIVLILFFFVLTGCSFDGNDNDLSSVTDKEPVHLTITYAMGDGAHHRGIQTVINDFKKSHLNVQITVVEQTLQTKGYADELSLLDAMGQFPDLMEMQDTQMFANAGLIAKLPESITGMFDTIPKINGEIYTVPLEAEVPQGIIYNKKLFRAWGLHEPRTYAEFLELCRIIRSKQIYPLVVGGKDLWHMGFWINHFMLDDVYAKNQHWNLKRNEGQTSWKDAGPKKAVQELKMLWERDYVVPGFMNISDHQTVDYLVQRKAAMLMSGPWMFNQLTQADPDFEVGFFPIPDRQGRIYMLGLPQPTGWAVSSLAAADSDKNRVIEQFLHFFYSDEEYPKYLQAVNGIPATPLGGSFKVSEQMEEVQRWLDNPKVIQLQGMDHYWGKDAIPPGFRNAFYELIQQVITDNISINKALNKADSIWDQHKTDS